MLQMKGRFVFSSGMAPREFDTNLDSVVDLVTQRFGSMFAFQDLGGAVEVDAESAPVDDVVEVIEDVEVVEEPVAEVVESKSVKKRKAAQKEEGDK